MRLDPDFTAVVHTDDYHVFLTEYDDHNALFVTKQTPGGFEVRAKGTVASGTVSWRVVGKLKSQNKAQRLAKFTMPNLPLPSMHDLAPSTPAPKT